MTSSAGEIGKQLAMRARLQRGLVVHARQKIRRVIARDGRTVIGKLRVVQLVDFSIARAVAKEKLSGVVGTFGERRGIGDDGPGRPFARRRSGIDASCIAAGMDRRQRLDRVQNNRRRNIVVVSRGISYLRRSL